MQEAESRSRKTWIRHRREIDETTRMQCECDATFRNLQIDVIGKKQDRPSSPQHAAAAAKWSIVGESSTGHIWLLHPFQFPCRGEVGKSWELVVHCRL